MQGTSQDHGRPQGLDPFAGMILALVFALGILGGTIAFILHPDEVPARNIATQDRAIQSHSG